MTIEAKRDAKTLRFYNSTHLGDQVFHCHYMRRLCAAVPDLKIEYACPSLYHGEVAALIHDVPRIRLQTIEEVQPGALDCWIGTFLTKHPCSHVYNRAYADFFADISDLSGVPAVIDGQQDMLFDHPGLLKDNPLTGPIDYLFVNSAPLSGQFEYEEAEFARIIRYVHDKGWRVITTQKVDGVPCTRDHRLNLLQIGSLARHSKFVIGINTAPLLMCFNKWSIDSVSLFVTLDHYHGFDFGPRTMTLCDLNELKFLISAGLRCRASPTGQFSIRK